MTSNNQQYAAQRPTSTIVESFSADLDSMFGLREGGSASGSGSASTSAGIGRSGNVDALEQTVEEKKQVVTEASTELQALEARLRDAEQRIAKAKGSDMEKQATDGATAAPAPSALAQESVPSADQAPVARRPQNTREDTQTLMARMPGALPQTPRETSASNDYVMVDRSGK